MKVHYGLKTVLNLDFAIVTSGTFDGVHTGHQRILQHLQTLKAQNPNAQTVVITFAPHPRLVLFPEQKDLKVLNALEEKIELLEKFGVDHLLVIPFDQKFAEQSSEDFVNEVLLNLLKTKILVMGYDHRFGKNRQGSLEYLRANKEKYHFEVIEIPPHEVEAVTVSSTKIRQALSEGNIAVANQYLGNPYTLWGRVMVGRQLGRKIGFPTANLVPLDEYKLVPADGIYAVTVHRRKTWHKGMLYIGKRETLGYGLERSVEVHIFDFSDSVYDEVLALYFHKFLRADRKFGSIDEMRIQLITDKVSALEALKAV